MSWDDEWEESAPARRTYTPAEAAADAALYEQLKRRATFGSLIVVAISALPLALWYPWFALALVVGGVCGVGNALLSMAGNEKLLERRNVPVFVLSSLLRLGLFGIVPVMLALRVSSLWTLGCYFIGFFMPLALYGLSLQSAYRRKHSSCTNK
jgi:hypothetical protein